MKTSSAVKNSTRNHFSLTLLGLALAAGIAPRAGGEVVLNTIGGSGVIGLRFAQIVQAPSAITASNYTVFGKGAGTITVTNVVLQSDEQSVALSLSSPVPEFFAVGVSNVQDGSPTTINTTATGYLSDITQTSIGTAGDPSPLGEVFTIYKDAFDVTASGSDIGGTNDHCHFIYQQVIGNFDMAAQITRLDNTDPQSKAGLMLRENTNAGSRMIQTCLTPTQGTNQIQMSTRSTTNGAAFSLGSPVSNTNTARWLRLARTNNTFTTYYGTNGVNWTQSGTIVQTLNSLLLVGMAVTSHLNTHTTTASFNSFGVVGARPGDGMVPTLSVAVFQQTNLIAKWQRTPRDFTVQVCSNLFFASPTNTGGGTVNDTNATQWAFLAIPVFDTTLTGTNAAMPTPGRYMTIPMNLYSNKQMFVRLAQVDRVIPDPISVTAGTIFSQASGNLGTTTSGSTICSVSVDTSTAVAQVGVPILCPAGKTYQFTTAPSGSTLQTVILVRNYPTIGISNCDASFTAGGTNKSQVTVLQTNTSVLAGYTFVAAVTATSPKPTATCPIKVQVNF